MDKKLEARLARRADQEEIKEVVLRYCRGVDRRDRAILEAVFVAAPGANGEVESLGKPLGDQMESLPATDPPHTHFVGNQLAEVEGDVGSCESYFVSVVEVREGGTAYTRTRAGRYLSRLERRDGAWLLAEHTIVDDWDRQDEIVGRVAGIGATRGSISPADPSYSLLDDSAAAHAG
jgi:hypothetical protein